MLCEYHGPLEVYTEPPLASLPETCGLRPVLRSPRRTATGDFAFDLYAETGAYNVYRSSDLHFWVMVGTLTGNGLDGPPALFTEPASPGGGSFFYKVLKQ